MSPKGPAAWPFAGIGLMLAVVTAPVPSQAATTVKVTGRLMDVNGHTEVPFDAKLLRPENTLVFETTGDGYH